MPKNVLKGLSVILGVLFLYGCAATKEIEMRSYVEVKDRVDQEMEGGNAGFIAGTPQPEDRSEIRKTRKIYVFEVSKEDGIETDEESLIIESDDVFMDESDYEDEDSGYESSGRSEAMNFADDDRAATRGFDDNNRDVSSPSAPSTLTYTIQKDDTLQKISKKFYDSYSKWPKIYELNKDVIDDPDRVKPGTVIQIPAL